MSFLSCFWCCRSPPVEPAPAPELCKHCRKVKSSSEEPDPVPVGTESVSAVDNRFTPARKVQVSLVCKQHATIDGSRTSPLNLHRYVDVVDDATTTSGQGSSALQALPRAPFHLPKNLDDSDFRAFDFCRHENGGSKIYLPHTWLDCSGFEGWEGTLFVNWATGRVQVDVPEPDRTLKPEEMRNWKGGDERWSEIVGPSDSIVAQNALEQDDVVQDSSLPFVDGQLWAAVREAILSKHKHFYPEPREKKGNAFIRASMGIRHLQATARAQANHENVSRERKKIHQCVSHSVGIYVFPEKGTFVRRRALLIACTYGGRGRKKGVHPEELPSTVTDVVTMFSVLVNDRGWNSADIVVLTDAMDRDEIVDLQNKGVRVEGSFMKSVAIWLGRLVSGLDREEDCSSKVANSLLLFMAGHGNQYDEVSKPGEFSVETDGKDEGFCTSSIRPVDGGTADRGVLLDDDFNAILCEKVFCLPRTQLVCIFDLCNAGTMADLPYLLTPDYKWRTDGEARRIEELYGSAYGYREIYDCGHGLVLSFGASADGNNAMNAARSIWKDENDSEGDTRDPGGALTDAFASSVLASGSGTVLDGVKEIQAKIAVNNETWEHWKQVFDERVRERKQREKETGVIEATEENEEDDFPPFTPQRPTFASSHFCRISERPLFL